MKKKTACVIKVLIIIAVVAAAVAAVLFYKNELLDALDMVREKLDSLKHRYLYNREYEDYEDDIL